LLLAAAGILAERAFWNDMRSPGSVLTHSPVSLLLAIVGIQLYNEVASNDASCRVVLFKKEGKMSRQRCLMALLLAVLTLGMVAARPAQDWPPGTAILHGFVFHDLNGDGKWNHPNGNGPIAPTKPETWEPGFGGVYFTASCGDFSVVGYSEPRSVDEYGHTFATGDFGPVLSACDWTVTLHVPAGYVATTPVQQKALIPDAGGTAFPAVLFGLRAGRLPKTGAVEQPFLAGAGLVFGLEMVIAGAAGLLARRRRR